MLCAHTALLRPLRHLRAVGLAGCLAAMLAAPSATGQTAPAAKPVRVINPFAAGGNLDIVTRSISQRLSETMNQPFVVENRVGAAGALGTDVVAKAPADGLTLLAQSNTFLATPAVNRNAGYDPIKDFTCVTVFAWVPQILVVNPSVPVNSVTELVALAKRKPGELSFGSAGLGGVGHITGEMFSSQAGIKMTHVPYKGNAPALTDVVGGQLSMMFDTLSTSIQYVKTGKLKGLAVTGLKRSPIFPNIPTVSEAALPGFDAPVFNIMLAPAGTPKPVIDRLYAEIHKAVQLPELRNRFIDQGVELATNASPEECNSFLKSQNEKYAEIVKAANIKGQ